MVWSVEYLRKAERDLSQIDHAWQRRIVDYLDDQVATLADPRLKGKALGGEMSGLWRFRVGDYRIVCEIVDSVKLIRVVKIGHRKLVYR